MNCYYSGPGFPRPKFDAPERDAHREMALLMTGALLRLSSIEENDRRIARGVEATNTDTFAHRALVGAQ